MPMPLEGIRIIDWTVWQYGPASTVLLGDLGAEVIKLESRRGDPARDVKGNVGSPGMLYGEADPNFFWENCNRNKKSLTVDLKKEGGREIVYRLVEKSDVFVHNFRQGVPEKLGLGYETLRQHNPKLIYAAGSGFGPKGPDKDKPGFDPMGLARSGVMFATGDPEGPPQTVEGGIADQSGAIFIAHGVLVALIARDRFGIGQKVDTSHFGSMISLLQNVVSCGLMVGEKCKVWYQHSRSKTHNPLWNHYCCADGKWLYFSMIDVDRYWPDFCKVLGIEHLEEDPRFSDGWRRKQNAKELIAILDEVFATKPRHEWMKLLDEGGDFIYTIVNDIPDLASDQQALENDYIITVNHRDLGPIKMVGYPVIFSETPFSVRRTAPYLGEHADEVLSEICGYTKEEIADFRRREVI